MSSEADILKNLDLGSSQETLKNTTGSPLSELLQVLVNDVISDLVKSTDKHDVNASRRMSQAIKPTKVEYSGDEVSIGITMPFYWKYVNYGVNGSEVNHGSPSWGTAPPSSVSMSSALKNWERDRGIIEKDGKYTNWTSFSKVKGKGLIQRGQKPRKFFNDVVNPELVEVLRKPIEKLLGKAIEINIIAPWQ